LHTEEAVDAIDYNSQKNYRTSYSKENNKTTTIVTCPYFITNVFPIKGTVDINHSDKDSFVIYMCVEGKVIFTYNSGETVALNIGETILIPASLKVFTIFSENQSELLEVYIK